MVRNAIKFLSRFRSSSRLFEPRTSCLMTSPHCCHGNMTSRYSTTTSIPISTTNKMMNVIDMRNYIMKVCGATHVYSEHLNKREQLKSLLPETQEELVYRTMDDSRSTVCIPLSNPLYRETYLNAHGTIRVGQLLEQLDSFSVFIAYRYNAPITSEDGRSPYSIVTAMVDELYLFEKNINPNNDIIMHGHVSWVGKSSIEVSMYMKQFDKIFLETKFLMVARDPSAKKAAAVHPLKLTSKSDEEMFAAGDSRKVERMLTAKRSLFSTPPTVDEMTCVHQLFLSTVKPGSRSFNSRYLPDNSVWMEDTKLKNAVVCFPQSRNVHNKVFGGFIMRMAVELAWSNAFTFSKKQPILKAVDDILFHAPVNIGSLILMGSQICIVEPPYYLVRVRAECVNKETGEYVTSNVFHFTFTNNDEESSLQLPMVVPKTYGEAMVYVDAKRRLDRQKVRFEESSSS